jgi:uncharacterized protein
MSLLRTFLLVLLLVATPATAKEFPKLTGRVVDNANLLQPAEEAAITQKLAALEQASSRQLVVATVPDLGGYPIEDYGYQLGRAWGIGQKEANNGVILLVAPTERKVRIEVGYGLEPIVTDALSSTIISQQMLPRFRANDYPGGINAGVDALVQQLQAPPEEAEQRALAAAQAQQQASGEGDGGSIFPLIFWGFVLLFIILPMFRRGRRGRRHRRGGLPVIIWGPGFGGGGGGGWGGGSFGGGGGGFGGFSGGGGSFGGGGASGSW